MIRYALTCEHNHAFEVWFASSMDYDRQRKRNLVACPACGSTKVEKAIMAPAIVKTGQRKTKTAARPDQTMTMISPPEQELRAKLRELREHLTRNADNVGKQFPEEARKMHYGESEHRPIYGEASLNEARDLHDEGVPFFPLPALPDEQN